VKFPTGSISLSYTLPRARHVTVYFRQFFLHTKGRSPEKAVPRNGKSQVLEFLAIIVVEPKNP
jgi:hypothetical protein